MSNANKDSFESSAQLCKTIGLSSRALLEILQPNCKNPAGDLFPLTFVVKDCFELKNRATSFGVKPAVIPCGNSTARIIQKLEASGATLLGIANLDELALGATGKNSFFGDIANPKYPDFSVGGSSGGCAAAVAAGCVDFAIGTDWGGSTRIPAAACEVFGFKCSSQSIPRDGVIFYHQLHDALGFLFRSIDDGYRAWSATQEQRSLSAPPDELMFIPNEWMSAADSTIRLKYTEALSKLSKYYSLSPVRTNPPFGEARIVRRAAACESLRNLLERYPSAREVLPEQARALLVQPSVRLEASVLATIDAFKTALPRNAVLVTPCFPKSFPVRLDSPELVTAAASATYFLELANVLDSPSFVTPSDYYGISLQFMGGQVRMRSYGKFYVVFVKPRPQTR